MRFIIGKHNASLPARTNVELIMVGLPNTTTLPLRGFHGFGRYDFTLLPSRITRDLGLCDFTLGILRFIKTHILQNVEMRTNTVILSVYEEGRDIDG